MPDFLHDKNLKEPKQAESKSSVIDDINVNSVKNNQAGYPGFIIDGQFWYLKNKITEASILLRKIRDKVNKIINLFVSSLIFASFVVAILEFVFENNKNILSFDDIVKPNVTILAVWFILLCSLFLFFRTKDKAMRIKTIPKSIGDKINNIQIIPDLNAVEKKKNIDDVLSTDARIAIEDAYKIARKGGSVEVLPLHIFIGILSSKHISVLFMRLGITFDQIKNAVRRKLLTYEKGNTVFGVKAQQVLAEGLRNAYKYKRSQISTIELFTATYYADDFIQELLYSLDIEQEELDNAVMWLRINEQLIERYHKFRRAASFKPTNNMNRAYTAVATPFLDSVSQDLTKDAVYGRLPVLIGRDKEMNNILRAIEGGNKSVILVGEPGVGKSAMVSGIAERMVEEEVPKILRDKRLVKISVPHIVSSNGGGEAQERLLSALQEIGHSGNIVTVIENIDQLVGHSGGVDLAAVLSSELEKRYTFVIATTTPQAYTGLIERSVLGQTLEKIVINEPERNDTIQVLESKIGAIENKNKVVFTYEAVAALVDFSNRYMRDQMLPEKAILLAQEVANFISRNGKEWATVTKEDVAKLISEKTNVPITQVGQAEGEKLLHLEDRMHERIIGQEEAVKAVASALRRARVELRSENRPIANFLFLGPTGVGKTELAKTTAEVYFGDENAMLRFDMSEYQDKASIVRLIGGAGSSGLLTEAVRQKPFALLLLDELEKAHPDILNLFLQVMDDGRLTDGTGRTIDFTNVILIATSNAGTQYIQDQVAINTPLEKIKQYLMESELKKIYRPEFLNRFDGVMVFKPLSPEDIVAIAYLMIKKVQQRLEAKGIVFKATDEAVHDLAKKGYDVKYGARPLRRVIQETVDNSIAEFLLQGKVSRRDVLLLKSNGEIEVQKAKAL